MSRPYPHFAGRQQGAALLVVFILLLIITILGLASMRGAIMQERMAGNTVSRGMAFQVAESGLRQAEIMIRDGAVAFPASGCAAGLCARLDPANAPPWEAAGFWDNAGASIEGTPIDANGLSLAPRFVIEDFGTTVNGGGASNCVDLSKGCIETTEQSLFRVTSRAITPLGGEVIVQSLYRR